VTNQSYARRVWFGLNQAFDKVDPYRSKMFYLVIERGILKLISSTHSLEPEEFFLEIPQAKIISGLTTEEWDGLHKRVFDYVSKNGVYLCP